MIITDLALALRWVDRVLAVNEPHHRGLWGAQSIYAHTCHVAAMTLSSRAPEGACRA
jgi:hypothetical protein